MKRQDYSHVNRFREYMMILKRTAVKTDVCLCTRQSVQVCGFPSLCHLPSPLIPPPLPSSSCCCGDCLRATDTCMSCQAALMLIGPDGESFAPVCSPKVLACHIITCERNCLSYGHTHSNTHWHTHSEDVGTVEHSLRFHQFLILNKLFLLCVQPLLESNLHFFGKNVWPRRKITHLPDYCFQWCTVRFCHKPQGLCKTHDILCVYKSVMLKYGWWWCDCAAIKIFVLWTWIFHLMKVFYLRLSVETDRDSRLALALATLRSCRQFVKYQNINVLSLLSAK